MILETLKDKKFWMGVALGVVAGGTVAYGLSTWINTKEKAIAAKLKGKGNTPSTPATASTTPVAKADEKKAAADGFYNADAMPTGWRNIKDHNSWREEGRRNSGGSKIVHW